MRRSLLAFAALITVGAAFYHFHDGYAWVDSLYFAVITITTVGFGDFHPESTASKLFTTVYSLLGVSLYLYLITRLASHPELFSRKGKG